MIKTKTELIKKLHKLGEQEIEKGVLLKELAISIKHHKESKTLKEWREFVNNKLFSDGGID